MLQQSFSGAVIDRCAHSVLRQIRRRASRNDDTTGLFIPIDNALGRWVAATGTWERTQINAIEAILSGKTHVPKPQPGGVFIDVGAHIGLYTLALSKHFDTTLAIEPHPITFHVLQANVLVKNLPQVKAVRYGASDQCGTARIFTRKANQLDCASLVAEPNGSDELQADCEIKTCDYLAEHYAPGQRVSLIKVDAEGHDAQVLRGAQSLLRRDAPIVLFEILEPQAGAECMEVLKSAGYDSFVSLNRTPIWRGLYRTPRASFAPISEASKKHVLVCAYRQSTPGAA